jgi:hypothetical protein
MELGTNGFKQENHGRRASTDCQDRTAQKMDRKNKTAWATVLNNE